jgi:hypothetical protein
MRAFVSILITSVVLTILLIRFQHIGDYPLLLFAVFLFVPWLLHSSVKWIWDRLFGSAGKPKEGGPQC